MSAAADHYTLSVRDDGIGFSSEIDLLHTETLGLQLVRMLSAQIGGRLSLETHGGTEFVIQFPRQPDSP
jgi:two-component sensor histidine kinase